MAAESSAARTGLLTANGWGGHPAARDRRAQRDRRDGRRPRDGRFGRRLGPAGLLSPPPERDLPPLRPVRPADLSEVRGPGPGWLPLSPVRPREGREDLLVHAAAARPRPGH